MTPKARGSALTLVLALLMPVATPFFQGLGAGASDCACSVRCCRAAQRPAPVNTPAPCHGPRRDSPACTMRCNHSGSDAPPPAGATFLPETDTSYVALLPQSPVARALRPGPRPGFGRIESPPPRPLLLAI